MGVLSVFSDLSTKAWAMDDRREELFEALRQWTFAERELEESTGGPRADLEAHVVQLRDDYHGIFAESMLQQLSALHQVDELRASSTPSTPPYHDALRRTEEIAANIWEQARRGDREAPPTRAVAGLSPIPPRAPVAPARSARASG